MHINDKLRRAVLVGQLRKYRRRITTVWASACYRALGLRRGVGVGLELLLGLRLGVGLELVMGEEFT